jgi:hypothetical protein
MAKTRTEILSYGKAQNIEADGCYSISFYRPTGSNPVNVNGFDLEEGQSLAIQQNVGDEDWSTYDIVFYTGTGSNAIQVVKIMPE